DGDALDLPHALERVGVRLAGLATDGRPRADLHRADEVRLRRRGDLVAVRRVREADDLARVVPGVAPEAVHVRGLDRRDVEEVLPVVAFGSVAERDDVGVALVVRDGGRGDVAPVVDGRRTELQRQCDALDASGTTHGHAPFRALRSGSR